MIPTRVRDSLRRWQLGLLGIVVAAVYLSNGREIGTYDSQPTRFAAIELATRGTLTLDRVVAMQPAYGVRSAFQKDLAGHYRSAYSPVPAILAAVPAWVMITLKLVDPSGPLTSNLNAKLTATLLTTIAVCLAAMTVARRTSPSEALVIGVGFGLGTNLWGAASQTLWEHETAVSGLMAAVYLLARRPAITPGARIVGAVALGLAVAARPQLAPAVAILAVGLWGRTGLRGLLCLLPLFVIAAGLGIVNWWWFGHPLGAAVRIEALHPVVHGVNGIWSSRPWVGAAGLLISPSRGLLIFSPIVLLVVPGLGAMVREGWDSELAWCAAAALAQFGVYSAYSVWWGGHTWGPRYMLDVLPMLVPLAAAGMPWVLASRPRRWLGVGALAWSIGVAALGAYVYPAEQWNQLPVDVDLHHDRLWDVTDNQIARAWRARWSPQNFSLWQTGATRATSP